MKAVNILKVLLVGVAALMAAAPALAQQAQKYVFAWSYESGSSTVYVSSRPVPVDRVDMTGGAQERERWNRALRQHGADPFDMSATHIGTPSNITYDSSRDADSARLEFIQDYRRKGDPVVVVNW